MKELPGIGNFERYRACERKIRFPNEKIAAFRACKFSSKSQILFKPYKCRFCKGWHLTKA